MEALKDPPPPSDIVAVRLDGADFLVAVELDEAEDMFGNAMSPEVLLYAVQLYGKWWLSCDVGELGDALQARAQVEFDADYEDKRFDEPEPRAIAQPLSAYAVMFGLPA